jgi:succinate dehydrogenase / fumarate reductase, flavoprotein subunit
MTTLESLGEVISTDVLIIGGGFSGLVTAIKVKEEQPGVDVLIVEKQTTGYAGKANRGGGVVWVMAPDDDIDAFMEYHVKNIGHYLEDQELLYSNAVKTLSALEQLDSWGAIITKNKKGEFDYKHIFKHWSHVGIDHGMMLPLRKKAKWLGVKIMDKVALIDLLKQGDRVVGAAGFNIIDGTYHMVKARSTVMANGSCNYMVSAMWSSGRGDGIAAAYRAGAEMRNAEFGNFYNMTTRGGQTVLHGGQFTLINNKGELLADKYCADYEPDLDIGIILGMEKEVREGKGPILSKPLQSKIMMRFAQVSLHEWQKRPTTDDFLTRLTLKEFQYTPDKDKMPEMIPGFIGELSCISVDHEMRTSLPGLWGAGDSCNAGSSWAGAVPAPPARLRGSGLMNTVLSALNAAPSAARYAADASPVEIDSQEALRLKEEMFAPMKRNNGYIPADAAKAIGKIVSPVKYSIRKNKDRIEEALGKVAEIKSKLPELSAQDYHGLSFCSEVKSMTLCAEIYFRSALYRNESRGWHYREDYPERDDKNWLSWTILKRDGENMNIYSRPVPIEKYKLRP